MDLQAYETFDMEKKSIRYKRRKCGEDHFMKMDLYKKIVDYIIENQNKFYRLAISYTKNQDDAMDAVQNSVCKALEHYGDLRNENAVRTWFYRIIVNESLQLLKERNRQVSLEPEGNEAVYEEKGYEPQDSLYEHINRLSPEVQTIIKLRFYEDLQLKEIAEIMDMNLNTVKARLYRGLRALRLSIEEEDL